MREWIMSEWEEGRNELLMFGFYLTMHFFFGKQQIQQEE